MADTETIVRLRRQVEQLEKDMERARDNPPQPDADGDVSPSALANHTTKLDKLNDNYQVALNNLARAEATLRDDNAKNTAITPERKAAAATRRTARGSAFLNSDAEPDDFYQDIEDALAVGALTDGEANRRHSSYLETRREKIAARNTKQAADRAATLAAQQRADQNRQTTATNRRLDQADTRETRMTNSADARESRLVDSETRRTNMDAYRMANDASSTAVTRAEKKRLADQNAAYSSARASGRSPQDALSAAEALPPIDIDEIADRAFDRFLERIGMKAPQRTTSAAPTTPAPTGPSPATPTAPPNDVGGAIGQAAQAAMAATPTPAAVVQPPVPYPDEMDRVLGRALVAR